MGKEKRTIVMTSAGWITLYVEVQLVHGWQQILDTMELLALKAAMFLNQVLLLWHIPDTNALLKMIHRPLLHLVKTILYTVERRVNAMRSAEIDVEYRKYKNVSHGFELGIGTDAEGWIEYAIQFWEKHMSRTYD